MRWETATTGAEALERAHGVPGPELVFLDLQLPPSAARRSRGVHLVSKLPAPAAALSSDLLLASLISRAALLRRESRGAHYRADAPEPDPAWRGHILWRRGHAPVFEDLQKLPLV